jgi:hypothetical protein
MKARVKQEYVGQTHPTHGFLVKGVVYEVDEITEDGLFEPADPPEKKQKEVKRGLDR